MSVSAVVICHQSKDQLINFLDNLKSQTKPPDEVIVCVCCLELDGIEADIIIGSPHKDDWGAEKCDQGLKLASMDYIWYCNVDDEPHTGFLERLTRENGDIIACDFNSHLAGLNTAVAPVVGQITRGCFIVRRDVAQQIGYYHRTYEADGLHAKEIAENGSFKRVEEVLYTHN